MASVTMHQQGAELVFDVYTQTRNWADDSRYSVLRMTMEQNGARQDEVTVFFDGLGLGELKKLRDALSYYIRERELEQTASAMSLKEWAEEVDRIWTSK